MIPENTHSDTPTHLTHSHTPPRQKYVRFSTFLSVMDEFLNSKEFTHTNTPDVDVNQQGVPDRLRPLDKRCNQFTQPWTKTTRNTCCKERGVAWWEAGDLLPQKMKWRRWFMWWDGDALAVCTYLGSCTRSSEVLMWLSYSKTFLWIPDLITFFLILDLPLSALGRVFWDPGDELRVDCVALWKVVVLELWPWKYILIYYSGTWEIKNEAHHIYNNLILSSIASWLLS